MDYLASLINLNSDESPDYQINLKSDELPDYLISYWSGTIRIRERVELVLIVTINSLSSVVEY